MYSLNKIPTLQTFYVYALLDNNGTPFYIGVTVNHESRLHYHLSHIKRNEVVYDTHAVHLFARERNFIPKMRILYIGTAMVRGGFGGRVELNFKERQYIAKYKNEGHDLMNGISKEKYYKLYSINSEILEPKMVNA